MRKLLSITVLSFILLFTGCQQITGPDVTAYQLINPLTEKEVIDYYADASRYGAITTRSNEVENGKYEEYVIEGEERDRIEQAYKETEAKLSSMEYSSNMEMHIDEDVFHYIKATLNNTGLSNGEVTGVTGALGYYFVDVDYQIKHVASGAFNERTPLIGINGAFKRNIFDNTDKVDKPFMRMSAGKINDYYIKNGINRLIGVNQEGVPVMVEYDVNGINDVNETIITDVIDDLDIGDELDDETGGSENTDEENEGSENTDEENEGVAGVASINTVRTLENDGLNEYEDSGIQFYINNKPVEVSSTDYKVVNVRQFNEIVGGLKQATAYMPEDLKMVYSIPNPTADISGIGIYASGRRGLANFGYDADNSIGEATVRYVFKDSENIDGTIENTNIYFKNYNITSGITGATTSTIMPDYLMVEFKNIVDRLDRMIINNDLQGLMSSRLVDDMGLGVLNGYMHNSSNVIKHVTKLKQVISRDIENNSYLIELETRVTDGAESVDSYGKYRDKYLLVIKQVGGDFKVTDLLRTSRELLEHPDIDKGNTTAKRLIALNLAGEVGDVERAEVKKLLEGLYKASTLRLLRGPKEVTDSDGSAITLEKGMYDYFNDDTKLLSTEGKEYINSTIRGYLTKYGVNVPATVYGRVDEWIGGYRNQVEFTTEEIVGYGGLDRGQYIRVYYLVSSMNDEWVIDEYRVLDEMEIEGAELSSTLSRIEKNTPAENIIENTEEQIEDDVE